MKSQLHCNRLAALTLTKQNITSTKYGKRLDIHTKKVQITESVAVTSFSISNSDNFPPT